MAEIDRRIEEIGTESGLQMAKSLNLLIRQFEEAKKSIFRVRQAETAYSVGDKVNLVGMGNADRMLLCTTAGTTAEGTFPGDYNALAVGNVVIDGTVVWTVIPFEMGDLTINGFCMAEITDLTTEPELAVYGGNRYVCTNTVTNLTVSSVANSAFESEIVFTAGDGITATFPDSLGWIGEPSFEAGKSYIISIRNNVAVAAEYTPGVTA